MKKALITGITGQDGSYLAEFLLDRGYEVHGIKRRSSSFNTQRIDHLYEGPEQTVRNLMLHYGDMTDSSGLAAIVASVRPDEVYNLAAQSHVAVSFQQPEYTANTDALGALRLLEAIRQTGLSSSCRFYQASTSELFGKVAESPQSELTPFYPRSPYGVAKLFAHFMTINYREAYDMYACNGILFNHESPRRGETFVSRKITRGLTRVALGLEPVLLLGNLQALRDWGHAREYVEMMWMMLQQEKPQDYVIATGRQYSVRDFVQKVLDHLQLQVRWEGEEEQCSAILAADSEQFPALKSGQTLVATDPRYFRQAEVDSLLGDADKARRELDWRPATNLDGLIKEMVEADLVAAKHALLIASSGAAGL